MDIDRMRSANNYNQVLKQHNIKTEENVEQMPQGDKREEFEDDVKKQLRTLSFNMQRNLEATSELIKAVNALIKEVEEIKLHKPAASLQQDAPEKRGTRDTTKPIDRNNVAPADVNVDKIFYFGKR
jgi:hypothetical protein